MTGVAKYSPDSAEGEIERNQLSGLSAAASEANQKHVRNVA